MLLCLSADYAVDFDDRRRVLEEVAAGTADLLWKIRDRLGPEGSERFDRFSLDQLVFIPEAFGTSWPNVQTPAGIMMGDRNPSDATGLIKRTIFAIVGRPSPETTQALRRLIADHAPSYGNALKHALALQRRVRRDAEYSAPTIGELRTVAANGLPETVEDMQPWFADRIEQLRKAMRASGTNMWAAYWTHDARPRDEDFCRDRLIEHISGPLPQAFRFVPEARMPLGKRADIGLTRNALTLPVEIKGQWNRNVWSAASNQLDAKYAVDWQAEGRGTYIVLWFGDVPNKQLPRHPDRLPSPGTPDELQQMLIDGLPEARRTWIDVLVIDVSRPSGAT